MNFKSEKEKKVMHTNGTFGAMSLSTTRALTPYKEFI